MEYKILSVSQNEETLTTKVEYNFDGVIVTVDVAHFMPNSKAEIEQNIINRSLSEKRKLDCCMMNETLLSEIEVDIVKSIV